MKVKPVSEYLRQDVDRLLNVMPFFKRIKHKPWQYELLLKHSAIVECLPGEMIMRKGGRESWVYFVLKGQLDVFANDFPEVADAINIITPGEVVGDIAAILGQPRTATVVASNSIKGSSKSTLLFGTDFTIFGEIKDLSLIQLDTKLEFYRNTLHALRWKLEVYRSHFPNSELADRHFAVKLYTGKKNTIEELMDLQRQISELVNVLREWNLEMGNLPATNMDSFFLPETFASMNS